MTIVGRSFVFVGKGSSCLVIGEEGEENGVGGRKG